MRVLIVGGVAGGMSAAARLRRLNEQAEIVVYERGEHVSFANCGLPYHLGGAIPRREQLLLNTPASLHARFNLEVKTHHEVTGIDRATKTVTVRRVKTGETFTDRYDSLILSPGAAPLVPPIPGIRHPRVLTLRNIPDVDRLVARAREGGRAVVVGGGYVGVEVAENLVARGLKVTLVELLPQVLSFLDPDLASLAADTLRSEGVDLRLGEKLVEIAERIEGGIEARLGSGRSVTADFVLLGIGVSPETQLAKASGLALGPTGAIAVDAQLRTSDASIFAVGDVVEVVQRVTTSKAKLPLAGPANRQGRMVADVISGRAPSYAGTQGTSIIKVFDHAFAATGANTATLKRAGIPFKKAIVHAESHASYYPGASTLHLAIFFSPTDGRLLGAQAAGKDGVDKRIDVLATALRHGATVFDLAEYELAYAPPFGSAKDPVNLAGFVASNDLHGVAPLLAQEDLKDALARGAIPLDVRTEKEVHGGTIPGALHIPVDELRGRIDEVPKDKTVVVYCAVGKRAHVAQRILLQKGHRAVNLAGGFTSFKMQGAHRDLAGVARDP